MKLLTVHPTNTRYFTNGSGRAIYLTASHCHANLQDQGLGIRSSIPSVSLGSMPGGSGS